MDEGKIGREGERERGREGEREKSWRETLPSKKQDYQHSSDHKHPVGNRTQT